MLSRNVQKENQKNRAANTDISGVTLLCALCPAAYSDVFSHPVFCRVIFRVSKIFLKFLSYYFNKIYHKTSANYKLKSRFAKFQNVPELLSMYRTFADVVTKSDLDEQAKQAGERPLTPPIEGGKPFNDVVERSPAQAAYMDKIIQRMENLPPDPRIDNPLKVTNDARKAGLDFRLIAPNADDYEGSKLNAAVARIYDIWRDTTNDKGTQLVFCDLSTPKGGKVPASAQSERQDLESGALIDVDGTLVRETPEQEDMAEDDGDDALAGVVNMDEVIAMSSGKFSVYDDMKQKLMAKGIPADEIAFIHDANTDIRKAKLFSDMNTGRVRVLLGSTAKMGAGMNVQKRLVAAHHLDAPWRPSDLEQRNGRIIRQGNMFYERNPDTFTVKIFNYATKMTYDSRMWQCIEYKSAAIEQFRKGDLLQRVIDDVASEAANAAEMKAAASGNPLILMQVQLAADLRKLEALYSQHQRSQHRMRDRLKYLASTETRLAKEETLYAENIRRRDSNTRTLTEKGKEKILVELRADGKTFTAKDSEKIKDRLLEGVKEVTRDSSAKFPFGSYRGFEVSVERAATRMSGKDGFQLSLRGAGEREFRPGNLFYDFEEKFSLAGLFQRMDNFLAKGLDEAVETHREKARQERAELETVNAALGKEFPQQEELALARENHSAVIRELQRMQDDSSYVSIWTPKTSLTDEQQTVMEAPPKEERGKEDSIVAASPTAPPEKQSHTLKYGEGEGRTEYTMSNQHSGYTLQNGYVLRRTYFNSNIDSLGQSLYEDGQWHSTATAPRGMKLKQFETQEAAIQVARNDAAQRGLEETPPAEDGETFCERLAKEGFHPTGSDFYGKNDHSRTMDAGDGGIFQMRIFQTADNQTGLHVQYEKYNLIDGSRMVDTQFDTLDKALEFVGGYETLAERPAAPVPEETHVRGMVFSSRPRMR